MVIPLTIAIRNKFPYIHKEHIHNSPVFLQLLLCQYVQWLPALIHIPYTEPSTCTIHVWSYPSRGLLPSMISINLLSYCYLSLTLGDSQINNQALFTMQFLRTCKNFKLNVGTFDVIIRKWRRITIWMEMVMKLLWSGWCDHRIMKGRWRELAVLEKSGWGPGRWEIAVMKISAEGQGNKMTPPEWTKLLEGD